MLLNDLISEIFKTPYVFIRRSMIKPRTAKSCAVSCTVFKIRLVHLVFAMTTSPSNQLRRNNIHRAFVVLIFEYRN